MADEELAKAIALLRRALTRINTLEQRVAALEDRVHWLDDLPEQMQGLKRLAARAAISDERVRTIAANTVDKRLRKHG